MRLHNNFFANENNKEDLNQKLEPVVQVIMKKAAFTTDELKSIQSVLETDDSESVTQYNEKELKFYQSKLKPLESIHKIKQRTSGDIDADSTEDLSVYISPFRVIKKAEANQQDVELELKRQEILKSNSNFK